MTPRIFGSFTTRKSLVAIVGTLLVVSTVNFTGSKSSKAIGAGLQMYAEDHGRFPRRNSKYQSTGGTTFGSVPIELVSLELFGPFKDGDSVLLPVDGANAQVSSFFEGTVELRVNGGEPTKYLCGTTTHFLVVGDDGGGGGGGGGVWPLRLQSVILEVSDPTLGTIGFAGASPPSGHNGQYGLTPLVGQRGYTIDSFFDVFFHVYAGGELVPGDATVRMALTSVIPEPATAAMGLLAAAGYGVMRRRRS